MQRNAAIDLVRGMACLGVLMIHASAARLQEAVGSALWVCALFCNSLFRWAVPAFFLCSGAVFLHPDKHADLRMMVGRYMAKTVLVLLVWGGLYRLCGVTGYLYFLQMLLLFYAGIPLLRAFGQAERRYALVLWGLLGVLWPTVLRCVPVGGIPRQWAINMTFSAFGCGLLSQELQSLSRRKGLLLFLGGFLLTFGGTWWLSVRDGALHTALLEGISPGPVLMAVGVWIICKDLRCPGLLQDLSNASLCSLLVQPFVLDRFRFLCLPLQVVCTAAVCLSVYQILRLIPFVRRWLI